MAKCPKCGRENPSYVIYCGGCGSEIPDELRRETRAKEEAEERQKASGTVSRRSPEPASSLNLPSAIVTCPHCGADHESSLSMCPSCGRRRWEPWPDESSYYGVGEPDTTRGTSGSLLAGGILAILAGILSLGQGLLYSLSSSVLPYELGSGYLCLCGGLGILFGLGSIAGGIFAIGRKNFGLAVVGAVVGMLGFGLVIGFLLGLIALILIAISKSEFRE